jgi:hypothetical protein
MAPQFPTAVPSAPSGELGIGDEMSQPQNWLMALADLLAGEPDLPIPGFPNFDEYVETMGEGWGEPTA